MLRANIYQLHPLAPDMREAVFEGVEMLASYVGEVIVPKLYDIRMPVNHRGYVQPDRSTLSYLDQAVELHVMAVPFQYDTADDGAMGSAYVSSGLAYVDTSRSNPDSTRATAAHETSHALGFVTPGARHEDPTSQFHCCTYDCLMHKSEVMRMTFEEAKVVNLQAELNRMIRTSSIRRPMVSVRKGQNDFCNPCKNDMVDNGARNIENLRRGRYHSWTGTM